MSPKESAASRLAFQLTAVIMAQGLGSAAAGAQATNTPPATSTNAPTKLPDVVVKGQQQQDGSYKPEQPASPKYTEPLTDTAQTITVVPRALIEEQGAATLRDVLRNVPGISIQAGEGGVPAGDNLSIRGFSARTDLFVDGVRDFGGYSRDSFNLEQVEVVKGPASTYGGRGSTGGSINLVTKTPRLDPSYAGTFGFGTDDYKRTTVDLNQPLESAGLKGAAIRLNGMWTDADVPGRDGVFNSRWGVAPSVAFGLGTPTRVTFSYLHLDQDNQPDYGIPWVPNTNVPLAGYADQPAPVDYSNYYGLKNRDYERTRTDIPTLTLEHDFSDSLKLRNLTRYGRNVRDSVITAPRFASTTSTDINRQLQSRDQVDTIWANQTDLTFKWENGRLENTLVPGIEFARETSENYARTAPAAPLADLENPNPDDPFTGTVTRTGAVNKATSDSVAAYAFDTFKLNEHWQINGGLRWDYFDVDYRSIAANGTSVDLGRTDKLASWRTGLVYKPVSNGSIYFTYGTSFNPSAEGLTLGTGATAANNVNTDPEESQTYEFGSKWDFFENRLSLSAAIFRTEKTNSRTEDPSDPADIVVLEGEQRVDGFELGAGGSITREWKVFGGYTYLMSEITKSKNPAEIGNRLSNTPEHSFSLWTTYELPWNITIGGGAQYVGERFNNNSNARKAPDYTLFDAMIAYQITRNFNLRLNVYNLTDETYIDRVGGGHFIPGAGRSAMLTASVKF